MSAIELLSHATVGAICPIWWSLCLLHSAKNSAEPHGEDQTTLFCLCPLFTKIIKWLGGKQDKARRMEGGQRKTERWEEIGWCEPGFVVGTPRTITSCVSLQNNKSALKYIWNAHVQAQPGGAWASSPKHILFSIVSSPHPPNHPHPHAHTHACVRVLDRNNVIPVHKCYILLFLKCFDAQNERNCDSLHLYTLLGWGSDLSDYSNHPTHDQDKNTN